MNVKPLFTKKLIVVTLLTLVVWYICYYYNFTFNIEPIDTIYYILIVFPLWVILGQAERRRFLTIAVLGELKAHVISLGLAYRDRDTDTDMDKKYKKSLQRFVEVFRIFLWSGNITEVGNDDVADVERALSKMSTLHEKMRSRVSTSDISRVNQYESKIIASFEVIKWYKFYGTSKLIVAFLETVLIVGWFILIPHFIWNGFSGIFVSPIITITFLVLINIERILDNPLTHNDIVDTVDMKFGESLNESLVDIFDTH